MHHFLQTEGCELVIQAQQGLGQLRINKANRSASDRPLSCRLARSRCQNHAADDDPAWLAALGLRPHSIARRIVLS
jgi:hypothetical protein